ncbi:MAG: hypothetical protein FWF51_09140 [Chitinivibrionia bacterium]|nr:hypothetical protein [Chitinivibrionia bacterium]
MDEKDKYREDEVCAICRNCNKFSNGCGATVACGGKNVTIYANSANSCAHYKMRERILEAR